MGKDHKGQPSGSNKGDGGTGIPQKVNPDHLSEDQNLSEKYTKDENKIAENVHIGHPNRNTDKEDATNIGGYRE